MDKIIKVIITIIIAISLAYSAAFFYAWHMNAHKYALYDLKALTDAATSVVQQLLGALGLQSTLNTSIPAVDSFLSRFIRTNAITKGDPTENGNP
jgi:hypothetical protein